MCWPLDAVEPGQARLVSISAAAAIPSALTCGPMTPASKPDLVTANSPAAQGLSTGDATHRPDLAMMQRTAAPAPSAAMTQGRQNPQRGPAVRGKGKGGGEFPHRPAAPAGSG